MLFRSTEEVLEAAGIDLPDGEAEGDDAPREDEAQVEKFREFLDHVSPEDFQ